MFNFHARANENFFSSLLARLGKNRFKLLVWIRNRNPVFGSSSQHCWYWNRGWYSSFSNTWSEVAPTIIPVSSCALATCNGKLYVIGGGGDDSNTFNKVCVFIYAAWPKTKIIRSLVHHHHTNYNLFTWLEALNFTWLLFFTGRVLVLGPATCFSSQNKTEQIVRSNVHILCMWAL